MNNYLYVIKSFDNDKVRDTKFYYYTKEWIVGWNINFKGDVLVCEYI